MKSDVKWRSYAWNVWIRHIVHLFFPHPVGDLQSSASSRFAETVRIDSHQPNYVLLAGGLELV